ncbi:MAG: S46 family peptidase [Bacteroidetes bacterium]|nr:S46 family peptidase [Bacteroidota bacterium]
MTKKISLLFILALPIFILADEGMWMPQLLEALNIKDMKRNGLKLTAKQIYDVNSASLKDAICLFGGGCTAEVISEKGLLLTNHHCGYSSIVSLSSVQNDYLKNGFWASNLNEEFPCKGLTITFIKRIDDVTQKVYENIKQNFSEFQKDSVIKINIKKIESEGKSKSGFDCFIRAFNYGNEYYIFQTETFKDIRLVGAPPENIGKFGGETDNWMWPRHNADFSMFRIYANKNNKPSEFSTENVPYKPAYSIPISLKGYEKGDFTMVYGFPGRTQEYLSSAAVNFILNQQDPIRVNLREIRLKIMEDDMKLNDTIRLMYASRYASIANYYKKWKGEMLGLQKSDAVNKKIDFEKKFINSLTDKFKKEKYSTLISQFNKTYTDFAVLDKQYNYFTECLWGVEGFKFAANTALLFSELKKKQLNKDNKFDVLLKETKALIPFKNINKQTDKKLCEAMLTAYIKAIDQSLRPKVLDSIITVFKGNVTALTDFLYNNSAFVDNTKAAIMFSDFEKSYAIYERDPVYVIASDVFNYYQKNIYPQISYYDLQVADMQKEYIKGLREQLTSKKFYPDANGTLRVAYGKVSEYEPKDGVKYLYYSTIDGLIEKQKTGNADYEVQARLIDLYEKKDFGNYADKNGKLRIAFIASNHTTGGNSGSPVFNANGELIGTNFDRNWEGTMSDIMYNSQICRNITLDIRYTLWIIDKYAKAGYLLNEMKLIKG